MKCPVCVDASLLMTERQGVEIDYCPQCRGVWLDRGELDKLIERSMAPAAAVAVEPASPWARGHEGKHHDDRHHHDDDRHRHGDQHRRRQSWFKDLFD